MSCEPDEDGYDESQDREMKHDVTDFAHDLLILLLLFVISSQLVRRSDRYTEKQYRCKDNLWACSKNKDQTCMHNASLIRQGPLNINGQDGAARVHNSYNYYFP